MDNMTTLRTFRAGTEIISSDPTERTDYDQTTWAFHPATGLELSKAYADGSDVVKSYDAYNRLATETDARGNVKTHTYEHARGLHLGTTYTVVEGTTDTTSRSFTYNHLGQLTQQTDDSGVHTFAYNTYGERESDSLAVDGDTHLVTELRDAFGRPTGYTYAKNGSVIQSVSTGYGADGRISSAGFLHGGEMKQFGYEYLLGTNLLHKLTKPNGMTLTQSYEAQRDLLTGMAYHRGTTLVAQREYTYDVLGRPTARTTSRQGTVVNDTFVHNSRSELASAQVNGETYGYDYDNVGNRRMSMEAGDYAFYEANELNQYSDITGSEDEAVFSITPVFDADGNQTMIKTATGIWHAVYNAENRPVSFTNEATGTVVTCAYDSMGRRSFKQVTVNGTVTLHQRYLYRGYLQIACIDLTRSHHPGLWLITWDPTQPIATRPLAIQKDGTWHTYGLDLTKNVCEVFGTTGYISTAYTYTPYGSVTATGNTIQPIQWSSEFYDSELALVYYNYRHYNPVDGRWGCHDFIGEKGGDNLYSFVSNNAINYIDYLGNQWNSEKGKEALIAFDDFQSNKLDEKHKCYNMFCNIENCTEEGWDCINFASRIISCGYLLNGDKNKSKGINSISEINAGKLSQLLHKWKWSPVVYIKDHKLIKFPLTEDDAQEIYKLYEARYENLNSLRWLYAAGVGLAKDKKGRFLPPHIYTEGKSLNVVGLIPDIAPYDTTRQSTDIPSEPFAFIVGGNSYHTGIYTNNKIRHFPEGETVTFHGWFEYLYASQVGWLMIPPDSANLPTYKKHLKNKTYKTWPIRQKIDENGNDVDMNYPINYSNYA